MPSIGQGAIGQGEKGIATHDQGMPGGQFFKTLQIVRQVPEQPVVFPNGPVAGNGYYYGDIVQDLIFHIKQR